MEDTLPLDPPWPEQQLQQQLASGCEKHYVRDTVLAFSLDEHIWHFQQARTAIKEEEQTVEGGVWSQLFSPLHPPPPLAFAQSSVVNSFHVSYQNPFLFSPQYLPLLKSKLPFSFPPCAQLDRREIRTSNVSEKTFHTSATPQ